MNIDVNVLREIATVVAFGTFVAILAWAYAGRNQRRFDEAANLPFEQD